MIICRYSMYIIIVSALLLGLEATARLSGLVTLLEFSVRSYLVGNAGSRPISEAKQPWACLVLRWGTTGEAHVLYSLSLFAKSLLTRVWTWVPYPMYPAPCNAPGLCSHRDHSVRARNPAGAIPLPLLSQYHNTTLLPIYLPSPHTTLLPIE